MIEPCQHWNEVFASNADAELGWYESEGMVRLRHLRAGLGDADRGIAKFAKSRQIAYHKKNR